MKFLNSPATSFWQKLKVIFIAFGIMLSWNFGLQHFLDWLNPPSPGIDYNPFYTPPPILFEIFFACIFAPLWEELIYRHSPALIVKAFGNEQLMLPVVFISSALFGWGHGMGPISLLRQGIGGLIFFYVYLKNGRSYWSSVLLHSMWNTFLTVLVA